MFDFVLEILYSFPFKSPLYYITSDALKTGSRLMCVLKNGVFYNELG